MNGNHQSGDRRRTCMTCALCGTSLKDENTSKEHVIPNALSGRKTVRNFICVE
ncbi:MAG: hypothetical protein OXI01_23350 [Albidovulum sp.]|nr:hypothetical protein [Albidovulum sp.]